MGAKKVSVADHIDEHALKKLSEMQCTMEEMAGFLNCSVDTLERHFAEKIRKWAKGGRCSLRRAQWKKAMLGDTTMLKHLGKVYLGQNEQVSITSTEPVFQRLLKEVENTLM